jgi:NADH-quinone oxidoreductase subunit L
MLNSAWLIPSLPLFGAIANGLAGSRIGKKSIGLIACLTIALSFLLSVVVFANLISLPPPNRSIVVELFTWISSGSLQINFSLLIDPLSVLMALVVTGVGFLIHVYSVGYMHADQAYGRYFSYLNLFVFFMLILVMSADYLVMYLGWEGVGLCSYLLIGFWYEKKSASDAGKKAFIVNRIGDFGFILGLILLIWTMAGQGVLSLKFEEVFNNAQRIPQARLTIITMLLFMGAVGKSAQFPLHVWLPDAMEGPTPVSALIHAATMVTAGVYMVARNGLLFSLAPVTGEVVAGIGIFTAFFAATIGLVQDDIKRVLAYSTISQLGYMFVAVGIGAYSAGIFHLMTHAFFKALLFLGAGSVIHAMAGEQDMRNMGGLYSRMKITAATFICGAVAIAGIPPFSGFWSKDEILWEVFKEGHYIIWVFGLFTAFLTAFYISRQVFMVFTGANRSDEHTRQHLHESPKVMTIPLIVLAVLAAVGGMIGIPFLTAGSPVHVYLSPVFESGAQSLVHAPEALPDGHGSLELFLMGLSVAVGLGGILLAALFYFEPLKSKVPAFMNPDTISQKYKKIYVLIYNKYYVDEIYNTFVVNPVKRFAQYCFSFDLSIIDGIVNGAGWITRLAAWLSHKFDIYIVDGAVNSLATLVDFNSGFWRRIQTGFLQNYALVFVIGLAVIVGSALLYSISP